MTAVIIANPAAGSFTDDQVTEAAVLCATLAGDVAVHRTTGPGHATELSSSASDSTTVLIAIGGDGTAREVVHGLAGSANPAPMFIVPAGTANSCFRSFWGELSWQDALKQALSEPAAHTRRLDLARLEETGTLVLAGASSGFAPQGIHDAQSRTDLSGRARYQRALEDLAATFEPYPGRVTVDGVTIHSGPTMLANVGGSRFRGGQFEVLPHSVIDDGLLDVCIIGGEHDPADMLDLARAGQHVTRSGVAYARGRHVTIERTDGRPVWFEHDGEVLAPTGNRYTLHVVPNAVPMLVGAAADVGRPHAANGSLGSNVTFPP